MNVKKNREGRTSADCPWSEVPEHALHDVEYIDGVHGSADHALPDPGEVPVPQALLDLPSLNPDRPTGSKAMLDAAGARARLADCRPGAWLVSPFSGWKWAKWPDRTVNWIPSQTELPDALRIDARDDLQ